MSSYLRVMYEMKEAEIEYLKRKVAELEDDSRHYREMLEMEEKSHKRTIENLTGLINEYRTDYRDLLLIAKGYEQRESENKTNANRIRQLEKNLVDMNALIKDRMGVTTKGKEVKAGTEHVQQKQVPKPRQVASWDQIARSLTQRLNNYRQLFLKTREELRASEETCQKLKKKMEELRKKTVKSQPKKEDLPPKKKADNKTQTVK